MLRIRHGVRSFKKFYVVSGYSIAYSGAENMADLPPITKEQDIELAQHTSHHFEGNTDAQGYTNEVRMLYFLHNFVINIGY